MLSHTEHKWAISSEQYSVNETNEQNPLCSTSHDPIRSRFIIKVTTQLNMSFHALFLLSYSFRIQWVTVFISHMLFLWFFSPTYQQSFCILVIALLWKNKPLCYSVHGWTIRNAGWNTLWPFQNASKFKQMHYSQLILNFFLIILNSYRVQQSIYVWNSRQSQRYYVNVILLSDIKLSCAIHA